MVLSTGQCYCRRESCGVSRCARASRRDELGVFEEFVDCPLVVRILSVLERSEPSVGSDQDIGRQAEGASGGLDRSEGAHRAASRERGGLTSDRRAQRTPTQQRTRSALDAESLVLMPFRVGDERERQLGLVLGEFLNGGVEDDDLSDAVRADLVMASDDRAAGK